MPLLVAPRIAGTLLVAAAVAFVVAPAALTAVPSGAGQTPADTSQQTFRLRIDSVSVDVIVLDRDGQPVRDLTLDDFEIVEEGAAQQVETFKLIDVDASYATRPTTHREILSLQDQRREAGRDDTRVLVVLLDDYHVRRGNSLRAREQLAQFMSTLSDNDLVAVTYPLSATAGLTFSRNHETTARSMMSFEGRKYDYTPRNALEERYQMQPPEVLERMRNDITIRALESLSAYMASLRDGRKTLLFVSEGLSGTLPAGVNTTGANPFTSRQGSVGSLNDSVAFFNSAEIMGQLRHVFAAANRANTSIYTLDPRGLAVGEYGIDDAVSAEVDRRALAESMDTLRTIAAETDGRAIVNRNNPLPELQQMVRDNSTYYLLGYTSSRAPRDGKFQEIQVRVKRPNVQVRARKGYWAYTEDEASRAAAPARPESPPDVTAALEALARSADPAAYRAVATWTGAVPRGPGEPYTVTFAWEALDGSAASRPAGVVDRVSITAEAADGRVLFRGVAPGTPGRLRAGGRVTFAAPPGTVRARLVLEDATGGRIDADEIAFEVAAYAPGVLAVPPPEVFRGRTARDIQTLRAEDAPVPTASRTFSRTERLLLRYDVLNAGDAPPLLALRLLNDKGEPLADLAAPSVLAGGRYEAVVTLGSLPPGDFLIELAASAGDRQARSLLAIRVGG